MKVVVMSDSHGNYDIVRKIVEENRDQVSVFIHLGDGVDEFQDVHALNPYLQFIAVKGNNDWGSMEEKAKVIMLGDKQVLLTHGDLLGVKIGKNHLLKEAKRLKVDIALYGHTHKLACNYLDHVYLLNPGSVSDGRHSGQSYLILEILPEKVNSQAVFLPKDDY